MSNSARQQSGVPFKFLGTVLLAGAMLLTMLLLAARPASAHDVLLEANPADGSEITSAEDIPEEVVLTFSNTLTDGESVTNIVQVNDSEGQQWHKGETVVDGERLRVELCQGLPQGEYTIDYRVVYNDGHVGEESLSFTNTSPDSVESGTPEEDCEPQAAVAAEESEGASADAASARPEAEASLGAGEANASAEAAEETEAAEDVAGETTGDTSSADSGTPAWVWWVVGLGVVAVAVVVYFIMSRGKRGAENAS